LELAQSPLSHRLDQRRRQLRPNVVAPARRASCRRPGGQAAFNSQQVALRAGRSPAAVLDEIGANVQRDIQAVEAASEADLQKHFAAPWGSEGSVAEVIVASHDNHLGMHIGDLRRVLA
jgi:hypothetical protein